MLHSGEMGIIKKIILKLDTKSKILILAYIILLFIGLLYFNYHQETIEIVKLDAVKLPPIYIS